MIKKIIYFIIAIIAVALIGFLLRYFIKQPEQSIIDYAKEQVGMSDCEKNESPVFTHDITDLSLVDYIVPPGHVEKYPEGNQLKTHSYIKGPNVVPIYAPIDSTLFKGVYVLENDIGQYALFFEVSCEIYYLFDHVVNPVDQIKSVFPDEPILDTSGLGQVERVEVKAGELIGYSLGEKFEQWDFGVYNQNQNNQFEGFNATVHDRDREAVCPYDFYPEEKRQQYYSLFGYHLDGDPPDTLCE